MLRHGVTKALRRQGRLAVRRKGVFTEGLMGIGQTKATEDVSTKNEPARGSPELSDQEWRERLQPQEYQVLVGKGTERPFSHEYDHHFPKSGHYACRACGNPLYSAQAKFDSGCGWPAFDRHYTGSIKTETDHSMGMKRVEIMCNNCGGHLGHVFEGEKLTETNERHCVNGIAVMYQESDGSSAGEEKKVL